MNKRNHFVESWNTGRDNRFRVALPQTHLASGVISNNASHAQLRVTLNNSSWAWGFGS
jgi:hypothetical protein